MVTSTLDRRSGSVGPSDWTRRMRWNRLLVIPLTLGLWVVAILAIRGIFSLI